MINTEIIINTFVALFIWGIVRMILNKLIARWLFWRMKRRQKVFTKYSSGMVEAANTMAVALENFKKSLSKVNKTLVEQWAKKRS